MSASIRGNYERNIKSPSRKKLSALLKTVNGPEPHETGEVGFDLRFDLKSKVTLYKGTWWIHNKRLMLTNQEKISRNMSQKDMADYLRYIIKQREYDAMYKTIVDQLEEVGMQVRRLSVATMTVITPDGIIHPMAVEQAVAFLEGYKSGLKIGEGL